VSCAASDLLRPHYICCQPTYSALAAPGSRRLCTLPPYSPSRGLSSANSACEKLPSDLFKGEGIKKEEGTPMTREGGVKLGKVRSWPFGAGGLVVVAIALLAAPAQVEGPMLVPISPAGTP
jgi:hypothetical protein